MQDSPGRCKVGRRGGLALVASFSQCNFLDFLANLWAAHANAGLVGENGTNKGGPEGRCGWCGREAVAQLAEGKSTLATRHAELDAGRPLEWTI
jgi:hypothetical protein